MKEESMRKSSYIFLVPIFFGTVSLWNQYNKLDFSDFVVDKRIILFIFYLFLTLFCIYGFLYSFFYKLCLEEDIFVIKTIFRKIKLKYSQLTLISCEKYTFISKYYILKLNNKNKKIIVYCNDPDLIINRLNKKLHYCSQ